MPESKHKLPHKYSPHQKTSNTHKFSRKPNRAMVVIALFFALLGLGVSYFIYDTNITALIAGTIVGGLAGSIFGYLIAKNLSKK